MKIERVDDKTVKCFLSNAELEEYEIDYKDFVLRSDKAKEIVKEIIEQAEAEVGYKPPRFAFDLQIMMLPEQGMLLTFSEKEPFESDEGAQIIEYLKQVKNLLQQTKEKIGQAAGNLAKDTVSGNQGAEGKAAPPSPSDFAVFQFRSLGNVMEYASCLPKTFRAQSALYEMQGAYYLYMKKADASYERYSKACVQALEFARLYTADERGLLVLKEHGQCLIAEKALKKLYPKTKENKKEKSCTNARTARLT
ncbi:MAG: adaptor protein MecA [Clostridium sp.]|nr:adaptor protein MecA [Clostridium sp.]